ncbi:hypothetical protein AVEN_140021-1 [Araneus ventricosus]|uniref:Uncharacterized protein n=1 Tax=Araneus ventricosus TaxID=182803 RepID=A0A4Y2VML2_ARAVE|nr:hypothetical protein AVEN_267767-1 [Araneus ventricosus]GBO26573.1 hypothetical protein AVEN_140021-1 [Araneus ventricosus]
MIIRLLSGAHRWHVGYYCYFYSSNDTNRLVCTGPKAGLFREKHVAPLSSPHLRCPGVHLLRAAWWPAVDETQIKGLRVYKPSVSNSFGRNSGTSSHLMVQLQ